MNARRRTGTEPAHHVVVLGAGYAGMAAAVQLAARSGRRPGVRVTLVNADDRFTERMRLHAAATGQPLAELSVPGLLESTGAAFVRGWVTSVDADARTVRIDDERVLTYDTLVYALGAVADTASVPGAADHAYTLDGAQDAALLAGRLARLDSGTVAVVGTGLTGIESAAEIAERYPRLRVVLLGAREPGADLNRKAGVRVRAALGRLGVEVRAGAEVTKVLPGGVELAGGEGVMADAVLWTGGTRVSPLAAAAGLETDGRGRMVTDAALRSVSHPEVYAVGDAAAVRQGYGVVHGTCQSGMPTGVHAALSVDRTLRGKPPKPFRFGYYHTPVSLGRGDAVVQFTRPDGSPRRICLTGRVAVRYKETVTASPWPTYGRMRKMPASGAFWPRGGRWTRVRAGR
ncbi:FAD-dependent oxidoreductase [Streptomyces cellulosae]|uniref:NADH dehydrogenase FAD-containing subunit n=1 Tax=Streptomyces thermodiastaticus TaxID=44061 RepID=A0ABU0KKJ3_9ACTN|nr:FAD-dependent oxidoreductase [Streptomyces sp. McG7]MCX4477533.1 FAD-dependent oxidoreductase [Streptomyces cellulosae]MDQ0489936.1 NADH dehydrogenase FAD-containing subunit [Streptomyces thermodiastaticus]THC49199.1 FAD-dependent oxidoreductase [Streptomyces sp. Akac8]UVT10227.1 FAD-dependent oxidoreductase [Streptomyces thermocarboxydus]